MTKEELLEQTRKLAKPIDFNELQRQGLISREGAWYRVPNIRHLPDYVALQIREVSNDSKGAKVKFLTDKQRQRADRLVRKLEAPSNK